MLKALKSVDQSNDQVDLIEEHLWSKFSTVAINLMEIGLVLIVLRFFRCSFVDETVATSKDYAH